MCLPSTSLSDPNLQLPVGERSSAVAAFCADRKFCRVELDEEHVIERRRYERRVVEFEAALTFADEGVLHPGVCRDLSSGGLYLATSARAEAGTEGRLITSMPGSSELITLPVVVRWNGHDGMGLQFGELGKHERRTVERALEHAVVKHSLRPPARRSPLWLRAIGLVAALVVAAGIGFVLARYSPRLQSMRSSATAVVSASAPPSPPPNSVAATSAALSAALSAAPSPAAASSLPVGPSAAPTVVASALPPLPVVSATAAATSSGTVPGLDGRDPDACIAEFFEDGAFREGERLQFVCTETDPRKAASQMRVKIVLGSGGKLTPAVNEWSRLGWHELAVLAIARRACCAGAPALQLPESSAACGSMTAALAALGEAAATRNNVDAGVKTFEAAASCLQMAGGRGYHYASGPFSGGQVAFASFMKRNER